jgi:predicted DNA-binding antitoxin AbrB/MazE fold protein
MSKIIVEAKYEDGLKLLVKGALENEIKFISIGLKEILKNMKINSKQTVKCFIKSILSETREIKWIILNGQEKLKP